MQDTKNVGLRGVTVADTKISLVDGEHGRLVYRGYDIDVLAESSTFEEVAYLLLFGDLPSASELAAFARALGERRPLEPEHIRLLRALHPRLVPMDALQALVPALTAGDPSPGGSDKEASRARGIDLTAKMAGLAAAWDRVRRGEDPVPADPERGHAEDFLRMLRGAPPEPEEARILDVALILHADHSLNASTFVARTVTSTHASMYAALAAALGALSGELHGGANERVMEMLEAIGEAGRVEGYVRARLEARDKIMGMGHAVYRTDDPRALILKRLSRELGEATGQPQWYDLTQRVEEATKEAFRELHGREIYPNVDMYSASVYHVLGIPRDMFTPVFAVSRAAGWAAHVIEETFAEAQEKPQLYRPLADYVGHYCGPESCEYVPLEGRGE